MTKRKTPRPQNVTIYMGKKEMRERRLRHLDKLAAVLVGDEPGYRSRFIQAIADGEFDDRLLGDAGNLPD